MHHNVPLLVAGAFLFFLWLAAALTGNPMAPRDWSGEPQTAQTRTVILTPERRTHILWGDERGGGHFHAADKPCKSEFPASWDEDKIIGTIRAIAANDNLGWRQAENGYHVVEQTIERLRVRVVLNADKTRIVTGYPVNVARNPCPAPANDNRRP